MAYLQRHPIPAGSCYVGKSVPILLQSFLGTCVAVAAYDQKAGVGGMIHILLPEPTNPGFDQNPERYATTGMPLFLERLCEAGAKKENLKAVIAGGALVGPVSQTDLMLNIGGRTAEHVRSFLSGARISVEHAETGGFFTCCLNFNLQDCSFSIEPIGLHRAKESGAVRLPDPKEIDRALETVQPIPQVALKILQLLKDDEYDIRKISAEVQKDQVISARTLHLCNSALFAKKSKIESLDHALVFLGQHLLVRYIISAAVENYFSSDSQGYSMCMGGLYHHAVGTGVVAEKIARYTDAAQPSIAYTAGLLHDIGKVVLDQFIASGFPLFYRRYSERKENFSRIEKEVLGLDHTAVGHKLAVMWRFPESLGEAIRCHHRPEEAKRHAKLAHVTYLADLLMSRFNTGLELERLGTKSLVNRLDSIGLTAEQLPEIIDLMPGTLFEASPVNAISEIIPSG